MACGGSEEGYRLEVEQRFVRRCAQDAPRSQCRCLYRRLVEEVPYEDFERFDRQRADGNDVVPPEIEALAIECAVADVAPPAEDG